MGNSTSGAVQQRNIDAVVSGAVHAMNLTYPNTCPVGIYQTTIRGTPEGMGSNPDMMSSGSGAANPSGGIGSTWAGADGTDGAGRTLNAPGVPASDHGRL